MIPFRVWCEEEGGTEDDARVFEAFDHRQAAEQWAERDDSDSADYRIVKEDWTPVVSVSGLEATGKVSVRKFRVTGYTSAVYSATEVA